MSQMDVTNFQSCEFFNEKFSDAYENVEVSREQRREWAGMRASYRSNERSLVNTRHSRHTLAYFNMREQHWVDGDDIIPRLGGKEELRMERLEELNRDWDVAFGRQPLWPRRRRRRKEKEEEEEEWLDEGEEGYDEWEEGLRKGQGVRFMPGIRQKGVPIMAQIRTKRGTKDFKRGEGTFTGTFAKDWIEIQADEPPRGFTAHRKGLKTLENPEMPNYSSFLFEKKAQQLQELEEKLGVTAAAEKAGNANAYTKLMEIPGVEATELL